MIHPNPTKPMNKVIIPEREEMHAYQWSFRRRRWLLLAIPVLVAGLLAAVRSPAAKADPQIVRSTATGTSGRNYWVTNHLVRFNGGTVASQTNAPAPQAAGGTGHEYLLVWAGDWNSGDTTGPDV